MIDRFRAAGLVWPTLFSLVALAILVSLGGWQWQRKSWKEDVIATISARAKAAPVEAGVWLGRRCGKIASDGLAGSCEYLAVRLTGTFDHAQERHVYTGISKPAGAKYGGQGFWILTPFKLASSGETIAVSRGFVPETAKAPQARAAGQIEGETTIVGLVREAEPRATFTGANDPAKNMFYLRNPGELFGAGKLARTDQYIDLLSPLPAGGLPEPTAGRIDIPESASGVRADVVGPRLDADRCIRSVRGAAAEIGRRRLTAILRTKRHGAGSLLVLSHRGL